MIASAGRAAETHDLSDDPRRMASAALMPLVEAIALLTGHIAVVPARAVSLSEAVGRIAGRDIISERDEPVRAIALRDGWAVRADDVLGASPYAPILLAHALAWVESGAAMPEGTDAVVPPEALVGRTIIADASAREGTRSTGEEIAAGTCLVPAGRRITPLHCLALEAAGILEVPVRVPCVRLVVTGSHEPDSVSTLIANLAISEGAAITERVAVAATPEAIAVALRTPGADATLVLGGTGFGRGDQSSDGLARAGSVHAHGIALRPGGTTAFGEVGGRPVLLLPGRPDAALSTFLTLGRPLLAALAGAKVSLPARAALSRKITSTIGLSEIVFARRQQDAILPLGGADLPLHRLIEADAAILVAAQAEGYSAGTPVEVLSL